MSRLRPCVTPVSSSRLTAFTLACVPIGINAGVSITPCAVFSRPRRALILDLVQGAQTSLFTEQVWSSSRPFYRAFAKQWSSWRAFVPANRTAFWKIAYFGVAAFLFVSAAHDRFHCRKTRSLTPILAISGPPSTSLGAELSSTCTQSISCVPGLFISSCAPSEISDNRYSATPSRSRRRRAGFQTH